MNRPTVWVTGVGAVSAAGVDVPSTLKGFAQGLRHPCTTLPFASDLHCSTFQAPADLPCPAPWDHPSRTLQLAGLAVREALADAGLTGFAPGVRVGVCLGTTVASQLNSLPFYDAYRRMGEPPLQPVYDFLNANLSQAIAERLNLHGPRMTVVNACSSGTDALGVVASWLRAGLCDAAIAGGADELNQVPLAGFWSLCVMSTEPCAPFDGNRCGLNLGEGAGVMILESIGHARARGMKPTIELAGFGAGCDAHHLIAPHPQGRGLHSAIQAALAQANITPAQVAFVNAHGTATLDNDRVEGTVLASIFDDCLPFLSTKGYTGHTLGAAGGLEAVFTVLGLREHWIPASTGFSTQAQDIPIAPVRQTTPVHGEYALSTSLAFGGNNAAALFQRWA